MYKQNWLGEGQCSLTAVESCIYMLNGTERGKPELKCHLCALWEFSSHLLAQPKDGDAGCLILTKYIYIQVNSAITNMVNFIAWHKSCLCYSWLMREGLLQHLCTSGKRELQRGTSAAGQIPTRADNRSTTSKSNKCFSCCICSRCIGRTWPHVSHGI